MAELKTKQTQASVEAFLQGIEHPQRQKDARVVLALMQKAAKAEPRMWGASIVGFGSVHYKYASGHEGDTCVIGFSPRKAALTIYLGCGHEAHRELLGRLGKHKLGKGCLYINKIEDVDQGVLGALFAAIVAGAKPAAAKAPATT